jgi:hypothetical protein
MTWTHSMKSNNVTTNCTSKQKRMSSELLLRIYMNAKTIAANNKQPRPVRTHYNVDSFG